MKALLDTQCWLWWIVSPERLSAESLRLIAEGGNWIFFSVASAWEIAIKHALGKLPLPELPAVFVPKRLLRDRFLILGVSLEHALHVAGLAPYHRDPFDRLLIAQSQIENLPILTAVPVFRKYRVELVPATEGF
jgi:PIN domain nuclease of toxin-antitoxin system